MDLISKLQSLLYNRKILIPVLYLTVILTALSLFRYINFLYYLVPLFYMFVTGAVVFDPERRKKYKKVIIYFLPFGIWAVLSSFWSLWLEVSLLRGLFFLFMYSAAVSLAILANECLGNIFKVLLPLNILIITSSILSLIFNFPADAWTAGNAKGFMGFAGHQNTLGALILFTIPSVVIALIERNYSPDCMIPVEPGQVVRSRKEWSYDWKKRLGFLLRSIAAQFSISNKLIKSNSDNQPSNQSTIPTNQSINQSSNLPSNLPRYFYFPLLLLNLLFLVLSYSRASILSVTLFFFLLFLFTVKLKFVLYGLISASAVILIAVSYKPLADGFKKAALKGEYSLGSTRYHLFQASYKAALNGGWFGLGYGVSDPDIKPEAGHYKNGKFIREKGNSFMGLIEEVGFIGFALFILPLLNFVKKSIISLSVTRSPILDNQSFSPSVKQPIIQSANQPIFFVAILIFLFHSNLEAWLFGFSFSFILYLIINRGVYDNRNRCHQHWLWGRRYIVH